jgi:hypothetical protein
MYTLYFLYVFYGYYVITIYNYNHKQINRSNMNLVRIAKSRIGKSCKTVLATKYIQPSSIYAPLIFVTIIYFVYVDIKLKSVK